MVPISVRQETQSRQADQLTLPYSGRSRYLAPAATPVIAGPKTNAIRDHLVLDAAAAATRRRVAWRLCQISFYLLCWGVGYVRDRLVANSREEIRLRAAVRLRRYIE